MTTYTYLGYGTTDSNGVAKLDHDANGDAISHSYTGTGAGKIDVVASLEDISDLTINVNPSTINDNTSGTTHSISATVLKDGAAVQNENVTFELRKQSDNTLVETLTGTTNSSGIATVSYSGNHTGLLYIKAFCDVVSQPVEVIDYIVYDSGVTGRDATKWSSTGSLEVSTTNEGTTLSKQGNYVSNILISGDFIATFEASDTGAFRFGVETSNHSNAVVYVGSKSYYRMKRENGVFTFQVSANGTDWETKTGDATTVTTEDGYFKLLVLSNERSLTFKNLQILPL